MFPENTINLVITQTNYDRESAIEKLNKWNGDAIKVVKEYLNPDFENKKKSKEDLSTNQQIMSSIRNFMDDVYKGHIERKKQQALHEAEQKNITMKQKKTKKTLELIKEINENDEECEDEQNIEISEINHSV